MKVLLAGANSYIGKRLIPVLLEKGHEVICLVRDKKIFLQQNDHERLRVIEGDLLRQRSIGSFPGDIDAAYYLVNSLTQTLGFAALEALSAQNFVDALDRTGCRQILTITEISNDLSDSAISRINVENILSNARAELTILQTTMIVGSGSVALELFNALTKKSPIVLVRNWTKALTQPIYTGDVLGYLESSLLNKNTYNHIFDIGGPEVLPFKQMLLIYLAMFKDFKPSIVTLPFLNDKLTSYLLNMLSPVSYPTSQTLIDNLKNDTICHDNSILDIIPRQCLTFKESLRMAQGLPIMA
ncbi:MAG TPA: NAD(P)H-binding protein [Mucilaginibacter sp.]|nr:NAD(P)H-binding protein [Mucilaginibacter sp.]